MAVFPLTSTTGDPIFRAQNSSINSIKRFTRVAADASLKLNTQERIVSPGDDALSFSTSRRIRNDIAGLKVITETGQLNVTGISIATDGLGNIKNQLDSLKKTIVQAQVADASDQASLQAQIDLSLSQINSTAKNTKLGSRGLLDGGSTIQGFRSIAANGTITDFSLQSGGASLNGGSLIHNVRVQKIGNGGGTRTLNDGRTVLSLNVSVLSSNKPTKAFLGFTAGANNNFAEFRVTGKLGSATIRIGSTGASVGLLSGVATAFNSLAQETGVVFTSAAAGGAGLTTVGFGSDEFIKVELIGTSGTASTAAFGNVAGTDAVGTVATSYGTAGTVRVNGTDVNLGGEFGTTGRYQANGFDIEIDFATTNLVTTTGTLTDQVNIDLGQGVRGVLGTSGSSGDIVTYGFGQFTTDVLGKGAAVNTVTVASTGTLLLNSGSSLGNSTLGNNSVADLGSGGSLSLSAGDFLGALNTIDRALTQVVDEQTRLGTIQGNFIDAINRSEVAIGNLQSADADIIGVDAATEITNLIQAQLGISTASAVLSQANGAQAGIFSLLRG